MDRDPLAAVGAGILPSGPPSSTTGRTWSGRSSDGTRRLLEHLIEERARIFGDVLEIRRGVWAIHGSIAVEGDVILAQFALPDEARAVLAELGPNQ